MKRVVINKIKDSTFRDICSAFHSARAMTAFKQLNHFTGVQEKK